MFLPCNCVYSYSIFCVNKHLINTAKKSLANIHELLYHMCKGL